MNKERLFIFPLHGSVRNCTYHDLYQDPRVVVLNTRKDLHSPLLENLRRCYLAFQNMIELPFIIQKPYLDQIDWREDVKYYVIFTASPWPLHIKYLKKLKSKYDVKFIQNITDLKVFKKNYIQKYNRKLGFDYIFTYERHFAEENGFFYHHIPYSVLDENQTDIEYDIYYIGVKKDRLPLLHYTFQSILEHGVSYKYRINDVKGNEQIFRNQIIYNRPIGYNRVIEEMRKTNCILEICMGGQKNETLRYYEAVCYNKKLLTTNKDVVNLPFYNPQYIHVFEKPEDIDWHWVKERIPVDYGYDGQFSPSRLIDRIIELEEEKEK